MFHIDPEKTAELLACSNHAATHEIEQGIHTKSHSLETFAALISPNITPDLQKQLAHKNYVLTRKRFGFALSLYIPLYYDNRCTNGCLYCGFNTSNKVKRRALSIDEILFESEQIIKKRFKNILLVAGEHPESASLELMKPLISQLHDQGFSCVSIEIAPLSEADYRLLINDAHLDGLYVYQETYNKSIYKDMHPSGKKADFDYRLATPERAAKAGISKIGIGFLLGLNNWREDALYLAQHLLYLQKYHWSVEYSISFPRIVNASGAMIPVRTVSDRDFIQLVSALRLLFPEVGMSLSTRELPSFRDNILPLGFTSLSAGSSTAPGGYTEKADDLEQFQVVDDRSPSEITAILKKKGFDPVWKDWS